MRSGRLGTFAPLFCSHTSDLRRGTALPSPLQSATASLLTRTGCQTGQHTQKRGPPGTEAVGNVTRGPGDQRFISFRQNSEHIRKAFSGHITDLLFDQRKDQLRGSEAHEGAAVCLGEAEFSAGRNLTTVAMQRGARGWWTRAGPCTAPGPWPPALPCSLDPVSRQQSLRGPWRLLSHWSVLQ